MLVNEYDVLRDEGEAYAHKLLDAGVPTTGIRLLGVIHDCMMLNPLANLPTVKSAIGLAGDMLRRSLAR